ncbi:TadE family type IV pilus minor pilin [Microbacterium sp. 179-B 1A2 NHS]|uniref:TadE family type IV pilus minor pilin n=1 Tax=Microbacterium sp. 179-B 1A2 NHS TaxID=3142383 RepID=UPI00399F314D
MRRDERGSAAAEFAVVIPAVVLVLVAAVSVLGVGAAQVRLEQSAAQAARYAARGESEARIRTAVGALVPGATIGISTDGDLVCVALTADAGGMLPVPDLHARSCALGGEGP